MVSWADECEEVNIETAPTAQEVDQITLRSGRQLQPPGLVGKEKGKEATPDAPRIPVNIKEKGEDDVIPSTANSKGITENKQLNKESKKDPLVSVPFQVSQGPCKEKVRYDVISHLKRIPALSLIHI